MIIYQAKAPQRSEQILELEVDFGKSLPEAQVFYLPYYRPGRYQGAGYEKNIFAIEAFDDKGKSLPIIKSGLNTWTAPQPGIRSITYRYFCRRMDAGGSWLDDTLLYLNPVNFLLIAAGSEHSPIRIAVMPSSDLQIIYPMEGFNREYPHLEAAIDSPFIASNACESIYYEQDVPFGIHIIGQLPLPDVDLEQLFRGFAQAQKELFGAFPFPRYDYLIFCNDITPYHGVEHQNNTVITLPAGKSPEENLRSLLGISSHELFHAWNVCRMRPKELLPYRLMKPVIFDTGYALEGFTTYYGDLMLMRGGCISEEDFQHELQKRKEAYLKTEGRKWATLRSSSRNLWANAYDELSLHTEVSIYGRGMLAAWEIDLAIRKYSNGQKSLDDVMRMMWASYGNLRDAYTHADIQRMVKTAGGEKALEVFNEAVG
jgi:predicted metalloprotease with PDZ domain